ncbi:unnamed protein product, partial [Staurois parvus]
MYVKCFETKMTVSKIFKFAAGSAPPYVPYVPTLTGTGTRKPDACIGQRRWPGTLQGTH